MAKKLSVLGDICAQRFCFFKKYQYFKKNRMHKWANQDITKNFLAFEIPDLNLYGMIKLTFLNL